LHNAVATAVRFGCPALQLFTKNASQWAAKPLAEADVSEYRKAAKAAKLKCQVAHDSYLINLAAPGDELFQKSINAFTVEIERAEQLGLDYLVMHPGAHVGSGDESGLQRVVFGLDESAKRTQGVKVKVLIETTAGQGTTLGWKFEHLGYLLKNLKDAKRYGVCLDTCHIFAAGYPLGTDAEYAETFQRFDDLVGLKHLKVFHINDSVKGLGSRVDRHAGLGLGMIGEDVFRRLATDPRFAIR
jgi:deoxyribonuclease-4